MKDVVDDSVGDDKDNDNIEVVASFVNVLNDAEDDSADAVTMFVALW